MAKKKHFEFVGVGKPTNNKYYAGIPVTYRCAGNLKTVYVFGIHPSDVMDRDADDSEVIGDEELAEDAIATVKALWQWFSDQRDCTVDHYLREKRTAANRQPSKPVNREKLLEACRTEL
jgi:hypothetical protein